MITPTAKPEIPQHDLVKHLASKGVKPGWIVLGIAIVTLPELLRRGWWLAPCLTALILKFM